MQVMPALTTNEDIQAESQPKAHLLLGLDNPYVRSLIAEDLRFHGHRVTELSDGLALKRLITGTARRPPPDLVVVDIELKGETGLQLLEEHRAARHDTPFVLLSREHRVELLRQALRYKRAAVLQTPFDLDQLLSEVQRLLCA